MIWGEDLIREEERVYTIQTNAVIEAIPYQDIFYLQKVGKYVLIHHRNGQSKVRRTLNQAQSELDGGKFIRIDRSYIVNLTHVMSIIRYRLKLRNGVLLNVSQPRYAEVRQKFAQYWKRQA